MMDFWSPIPKKFWENLKRFLFDQNTRLAEITIFYKDLGKNRRLFVFLHREKLYILEEDEIKPLYTVSIMDLRDNDPHLTLSYVIDDILLSPPLRKAKVEIDIED